jgi:hypothetical protein
LRESRYGSEHGSHLRRQLNPRLYGPTAASANFNGLSDFSEPPVQKLLGRTDARRAAAVLHFVRQGLNAGWAVPTGMLNELGVGRGLYFKFVFFHKWQSCHGFLLFYHYAVFGSGLVCLRYALPSHKGQERRNCEGNNERR